ncbi:MULTISPECIES: mechanosensitive channel MscK [Halomonadaceae]|uniref:Potassium transporter KefA n=1 Tax=Halomonas johnsoniae TaxID=502832 RepID=A0ABQ2W9L5_9GAMM|nr:MULTISPECIES: mechanosensitive channel MscK [Halomonas]ATH78352.1 mechanosensitive channel MscK [Halomonas hydrothermalis]GGW43838.1 potassium transporter KefA [Halomonas johnsoniae]
MVKNAMKAVSGALGILLCVVLLCVSPMGWAEDGERAPSESALNERLAALESQEGELTAAQQREQAALSAALQAYERLTALEERQRALEQRVSQAPEQLLQLERELREAEEESQQLSVDSLSDMPLEALEAQQGSAVIELQQLQSQLAEVNSQLLAAQTLPERAQQAISEALQRAETLRREHDTREALLADRQLSAREDAQLIQWRLERSLAEQEVSLNQRELSANSRLRELAQQRRELLALQIDHQEQRLNLLQGVIDRQRRLQSEQAIADAARDDPLIAEGHPVVLRAQQMNQTLSLELLRATDRANSIVRENIEAQRQLELVRQLQRSLNEQLEAIRGSQLLSRILREQRQSLPVIVPRRDLQDEIADLRLKQFDLIRQRDQLRQGERLATQRLQEAGVEVTPGLVDSLTRLYQSRRELVEQLEQSYGSLLSAAIELQLNQQQLLTTTHDLRATIDEQLFWVANSRPLDLNWVRQLPNYLQQEWQQGEWRAVLPNRWQGLGWDMLVGAPLLLLSLTLLGLRSRIKAALARLHSQIGRLKSDTQLHTPKAVLMNALLALPGPLALAGAGVALRTAEGALAMGLAPALLQLSLSWGVVALGRRLLVPDGVAERHFTWAPAYNARLRQLLGGLGIALVPVVGIAAMSEQMETPLAMRPVAMGLFMLGLLAMAWWLMQLILAHVPIFGVRLFRLVLGLAMASVPLVMLGLVAWGYEYTALRLVARFAMTLYLLGLWVVVEATVVRSLAVAARRLAYRRALARRRAQVQEGAEGGLEVVEEPPLDMEKINTQSLRLSKLILLIGFSLLLYLVWSDLLAVLGYLDQVALWDADEGDLVDNSLSLSDFFTALLVVAITFIMARNLPGLLEVMVLSRLALKQGSAYAISSLLSYTIVGTGVVMSLATLGVSWDKLQWLVAALSVGLGFGLQEIFANFISGLIILFERPIRIGDTITLGNLHGTVSRIRIRATTVTDFDRKEIIIPNKTFVTDQLINWSLSDNVTRVVLTYGVAHGSDLPLVHQLLRQAADENPRVLADPEPQVFYLNYGPHSLNFELRIFVNDLLDRLFAADEVNCRVDELFREAGVRVAFEQMDVWLHRDQGESVKVQTRKPLPPENLG